MQVVMQGINAIVGFIVSVVSILFNILLWAFDALAWLAIQLTLCLIGGFMTVIQIFVGALDLGSLGLNAAAAWGYIDPNIAGGINACGLPTGLSIIGTGILIRMVLNLIPGALTRI